MWEKVAENQRDIVRIYVLSINSVHRAACCRARGGTLVKILAGLRWKMIEIDSEIRRLYNRNKEK